MRFLAFVVGTFALNCIGSAAQRNVDVPQPSQSGRIERIAPLALTSLPLHDPLWTLRANGTPSVLESDPPVAGDGAFFSGDRYGGSPLTATDERSGNIRWTSEAPASALAYADRLVFAVTALRRFDTTRVLAVDSATGKERWNTPGSEVYVFSGIAIVTNGSRIEARDAASGSLRWSALWSGAHPREVRLYGSTLVLRTIESGATMVGVLYAYDVRDGHALWTLGSANAILGLVPGNAIAVDTTWGPGAFANYAPLSVAVISLIDGTKRTSYSYAPDRERWKDSADHDVHFAQDGAVDTRSLVFRIGANTIYRYGVGADPSGAPGTRYELGSIADIAENAWLVRTHDGTAALMRFDASAATLARLDGIDAVDFTAAYDGLAFVAGRDRAVVLDPQHPENAMLTRFPCSAVARAFLADGALIADCTAPTRRLIALALPQTYVASASRTPIVLVTHPVRSFAATMHPSEVPASFVTTRGAAFGADRTLWFCEHATMTSGIAGHSDFIGHLKRDGSVAEFAVPTIGANVTSIVRGPDAAMWFLEASMLKLGRISSDGTIVEFTLPAELDRLPAFAGGNATPPPLADPAKTGLPQFGRARTVEKLRGLTVGADGALWLTAPYAGALARVTAAGTAKVYPLPAGVTYPGVITRGPDDALWFTAHDAIGRMTTTGDVKAYALPHELPLTSIVWGPDANVWFSYFDGRIGRISMAGDVTVFPAPIVAAPAGPLIGGCDGALYVADPFRPALWRVTTKGEFVQHDLSYSIGALARAPDCTLGFTESQSPRTAHVGTISF